jgi:hypothetical protein
MKLINDTSRRQFLSGAVGLSAAAVIPLLNACTKQPEQKTSSQQKPASHSIQARPLQISIQGSFAIFVSTENVMVYAPDVKTHYYRVTDGPIDKCDFGNSRWDLSFFKKPDLDLTANINGAANPPKFDTVPGSNVIDTTINPVMKAGDVHRPVAGEYLYSIKLPLPDSVRSECKVGKDYGDFFVKPRYQLDDLARVHVFEYNDYDPANIKIYDFLVQFFPGEERIKILSEPVDQEAAINQCLQHAQEANKALSKMLLQVPDGIEVSEKYCIPTAGGIFDASAHSKHKGPETRSKHKKDDDGGVDPHSRIPACMSMLINDTGTGTSSVVNPLKRSRR